MNSELESMLETALWSTVDFDGESLDANYSIEDIPQDFKDKCEELLNDFKSQANELITDDDTAHLGHDFWLTLHGHGAGFWDGDYENGEALTEIAQSFMTLEDELRDILPDKEV